MEEEAVVNSGQNHMGEAVVKTGQDPKLQRANEIVPSRNTDRHVWGVVVLESPCQCCPEQISSYFLIIQEGFILVSSQNRYTTDGESCSLDFGFFKKTIYVLIL